MKLTKKFLNEKSACDSGITWFLAQKETNSLKVLKKLIKEDRLDWANWLIVRVMTRPQYLTYAIYAAEQVIDIYEKKYSSNDKPRKAIEAAKAVLKDDTKENRKAASAAADAAAYAYAAADAAAYASDAAYAAAYAAADAAAYASDAAYAAAYAAADAAAYASDAAYAAAAYAADAPAYAAARKQMKLKILEYGISLLEQEARQ